MYAFERARRPFYRTRSMLLACTLSLAGVGMYFAPDNVAGTFRGAVMDTLRPSQQVVRLARESISEWFHESVARSTDTSDEINRLTTALAAEQHRNRKLQVCLAEFVEQQSIEKQVSQKIKRYQPLILPTLLEVAVLGDTVAEQWRAGKVLDQGAKNGIREQELVLSSKSPVRPLIDVGAEAEIEVEDRLLLGRCVIGKVEHVGRWTSTFQLVTDNRYRGRAQLIRETEAGIVFESQGILKGQGGPLCRLVGIPADKSVHVCDAVYTADRDGTQPTLLYYGEVVDATLGMDDREWTVLVKPAALPSQLTTVHVLRTAVNPDRMDVQ